MAGLCCWLDPVANDPKQTSLAEARFARPRARLPRLVSLPIEIVLASFQSNV
jgi:hypothetical protein